MKSFYQTTTKGSNQKTAKSPHQTAENIKPFQQNLMDFFISLSSPGANPTLQAIQAIIKTHQYQKSVCWDNLVQVCDKHLKKGSKRKDPQFDLFCRAVVSYQANLTFQNEIETAEQLFIAQQKREAIHYVIEPEIARLKKLAATRGYTVPIQAKIAAYAGLISAIKESDKNRTLSEILAEGSPEMNKVVVDPENKNMGFRLGEYYQASIQETLHLNSGSNIRKVTSKSILDKLRDELTTCNPHLLLQQITSTKTSIMSTLTLRLQEAKKTYRAQGRSKHLKDFDGLLQKIDFLQKNADRKLKIDVIQEAFLKEARHYGKSLPAFIERLHTFSKDYEYPRQLMRLLKSLYTEFPEYPNPIKELMIEPSLKSEKDSAAKPTKEPAKAPSITQLVFAGGGAKGVTLGGAYQALGRADLFDFDNVKKVSGASVGALTAAFVAMGMSPDAFRKQVLQELNFKKLLGKKVGYCGEGTLTLPLITKDGETLLNTLRDKLRGHLKCTLDSFKNNNQLNDQIKKKINRLYTKLQNKNPITFKDLKTLSDAFPDKFKELTVVAVSNSDGQLQIFNADETPHVEIALACRASASLPCILEPVEIKINGEQKKFIDGGLYDNQPANYFDKVNEQYTNQSPDKTLIFAFGSENNKSPIHQIVHRPLYDKELVQSDFLNKIVPPMPSNFTPPKLKKELLSRAKKEIFKRTGETASQEQLENARKMYTFFEKTIESNQFWVNFKPGTQEDLKNHLKKKLTPRIYQPSRLERLKRDSFLKWMGFKGNYKNTEQKEKSYQDLRNQYQNRIVKLTTGGIQTTHFDKAQQHAKVLDVFGYLDTIYYLTSHGLHKDSFNPKDFYLNLVKGFISTYISGKKHSEQDPLIKKIKFLRDNHPHKQTRKKGQVSEELYDNDLSLNLAIYQLIKSEAEKNLASPVADTLAKAVKNLNQTSVKAVEDTNENVVKDTNENVVEDTNENVKEKQPSVTGLSMFSASPRDQKQTGSQNVAGEAIPHPSPTRGGV